MLNIHDMTVTDLHKVKDCHILVDVREPHEFSGPDGYIEGSILTPLGIKFSEFLRSANPNKSYVFICRSGYRSAQACEMAHAYGFFNVYNLSGGLLAWQKSLKNF